MPRHATSSWRIMTFGGITELTRDMQGVFREFVRTGQCRYGEVCRFVHVCASPSEWTTRKPTKRARLSDGDTLQDDFECAVCYELPESPILQCKNGHTLCQSCYTKCSKCPLCRHPLDQKDPIRALKLENIAEKVLFPCPYEGCTSQKKIKDMKPHKSSCAFRPVRCITAGCQQEFASLEEWVAHFEKETGCECLQMPDTGNGVFQA